MSPERWQRRLAKRGLSVNCLEHGFGYDGECIQSEWTAFVEPLDHRRNDSRFAPLIGVGSHISRGHAVKLAIASLDQRIDDLEREIAVLALAGKATK